MPLPDIPTQAAIRAARARQELQALLEAQRRSGLTPEEFRSRILYPPPPPRSPWDAAQRARRLYITRLPIPDPQMDLVALREAYLQSGLPEEEFKRRLTLALIRMRAGLPPPEFPPPEEGGGGLVDRLLGWTKKAAEVGPVLAAAPRDPLSAAMWGIGHLVPGKVGRGLREAEWLNAVLQEGLGAPVLAAARFPEETSKFLRTLLGIDKAVGEEAAARVAQAVSPLGPEGARRWARENVAGQILSDLLRPSSAALAAIPAAKVAQGAAPVVRLAASAGVPAVLFGARRGVEESGRGPLTAAREAATEAGAVFGGGLALLGLGKVARPAAERVFGPAARRFFGRAGTRVAPEEAPRIFRPGRLQPGEEVPRLEIPGQLAPGEEIPPIEIPSKARPPEPSELFVPRRQPPPERPTLFGPKGEMIGEVSGRPKRRPGFAFWRRSRASKPAAELPEIVLPSGRPLRPPTSPAEAPEIVLPSGRRVKPPKIARPPGWEKASPAEQGVSEAVAVLEQGRVRGENVSVQTQRLLTGRLNAERMRVDAEIATLRRIASKARLRFSRTKPTDAARRVLMAAEHPRGVEEAALELGLSPGEKQFAQALRDVFSREGQLLREVDPDVNLVDVYVPHLFKKGKPGTFFLRERKLPGTLVEILERRPDLAPVTWDPIELAEIRLAAGARHRALKRVGMELERRGLLIPQEEARARGLFDWRRPKVHLFTEEPMVADPEVAKGLEYAFNVSPLREHRVLRTLFIDMPSLSKLLKVAFSPAQYVDYQTRVTGLATSQGNRRLTAPVLRAMKRALKPGLHEEMLKADWENPVRRMLVEEGLNIEAGLGYVGNEFRDFLENTLLAKIPAAGKLVKGLSSRQFQISVREMAFSTAEELYWARKIAAQLSGKVVNDRDLAAQVARDVNQLFSMKPSWQSLIRNPLARDIINILPFSMPELEGWLTMPLRAPGALAGMVFNTLLFANAINFITTGKPLPPEAYQPWRWDPKAPFGTRYNTQFLRPQIGRMFPSGKPIFLDLLGQVDTPFRLLFDHANFVRSRLSVPVSTALQLWEGKEFMTGKPLRSPEDIAKFLGKQAAPMVLGLGEKLPLPYRILQSAGFNVSAGTGTQARDYWAQEEYGKPFEQLPKQDQLNLYRKHPEAWPKPEDLPEGTAERKALELVEGHRDFIRELGEQYERGEIDGRDYRIKRARHNREFAARMDDLQPEGGWEARTFEGEVVTEFFKRMEERVSEIPEIERDDRWPEVEAQVRRELEAEYGEQGLDLLDRYLTASLDPVEKQYKEAMLRIEESEYFDIPDAVIRNLAAQGYWTVTTYREWEREGRMQAKELGISFEQTPIYRKVRSMIESSRERLREARPDIDADLVQWGFVSAPRTPAASEILRQRTGVRYRVATR